MYAPALENTYTTHPKTACFRALSFSYGIFNPQVTMCSTGLDNYMMYTANAGVYTHTVKYEKDEACPICSAGTLLEVAPDATLQQVCGRIACCSCKHPSTGHASMPHMHCRHDGVGDVGYR